jgi:hypothetical protein
MREQSSADPPNVSWVKLNQQMSEVISLRERVAQAELTAKRFGLSAKPVLPASSRELPTKPGRGRSS